MFVAFDDTDSKEWMCTTFLATEIIDALRDLDLIGMPRLVRLNPAVPWKTRGNAALCLRFGHGRGQATAVGVIRGTPYFCYPREEGEVDPGSIMERCSALIERWSQVRDDASPGLVVSSNRPSQRFYWRAVRDIVAREDVDKELHRIGAQTFTMSGGRGVIGATAAMAWRPMDHTYEVITYRAKERWGLPRTITDESIQEMDRCHPTTFNNFDTTVDHRAIAPHTPCPVLFGIRGDDPYDLAPAMRQISSEPIDRWITFLSNQGTDDHIIKRWRELVPDRSYEVEATVASEATTLVGGHVVLPTLTRGETPLDMTFYEPSKSFREVARGLRPGDKVRAMGELRAEPRTLNVEKIEVVSLAPARKKTSNPRCSDCDKSMQSLGRGAGYRCRRCGRRAGEEQATYELEARTIAPGWYEPPVCARRHLSKPLKRVGLEGRSITL